MRSTETTWDPNLIGTTVSHDGREFVIGTWTDSTTSYPNQYPYRLWPVIRGGDGTDDDSGDGGSTEGDQDSGGTSTDKDDEDDKTKGKGKTFTQEEVNAIAAKEASKAARGKIDPKELGFDSAKSMQEFVEQMKAKADGEKGEAEKALEQAVKDATEKATSEVLATANTRVVKSEFLLAAKDHDIESDAATDAYTLAQTMTIWEEVDIDESGVVTGFDDAFFTALKEAKPFLFKQAGGTGGSGDIGGGARGGDGKIKPGSEEDLRSKYSGLPKW